jgi:hypothetical protein
MHVRSALLATLCAAATAAAASSPAFAAGSANASANVIFRIGSADAPFGTHDDFSFEVSSATRPWHFATFTTPNATASATDSFIPTFTADQTAQTSQLTMTLDDFAAVSPGNPFERGFAQTLKNPGGDILLAQITATHDDFIGFNYTYSGDASPIDPGTLATSKVSFVLFGVGTCGGFSCPLQHTFTLSANDLSSDGPISGTDGVSPFMIQQGETFSLYLRSLNVAAFAQSVVPEPSAWALMITGCGLLGAALRRRTARLWLRPR